MKITEYNSHMLLYAVLIKIPIGFDRYMPYRQIHPFLTVIQRKKLLSGRHVGPNIITVPKMDFKCHGVAPSGSVLAGKFFTGVISTMIGES